jgi:hypothetical protein
MSHGCVNTFALVINILNETWVPIHIIMGLFEMNMTIEQSNGYAILVFIG